MSDCVGLENKVLKLIKNMEDGSLDKKLTEDKSLNLKELISKVNCYTEKILNEKMEIISVEIMSIEEDMYDAENEYMARDGYGYDLDYHLKKYGEKLDIKNKELNELNETKEKTLVLLDKLRSI